MFPYRYSNHIYSPLKDIKNKLAVIKKQDIEKS